VERASASPVVSASASLVMRPCACVSHVLYCLGGRVAVVPRADSWVVAVVPVQDMLPVQDIRLCCLYKTYRTAYAARTSFSL